MIRDNDQLELRFQAQPNRTYSIESRERLENDGWKTVRTLAPGASDGEVGLRELIKRDQRARFFRLMVLP